MTKPKPASLHLRPYKSRAIAELVPYERNARTHDDVQVEQIAASIREFGFTNPVLVDEQSRIIAGHGRVLAAASLGMAEVPTLEVAGLTDEQRRALVLDPFGGSGSTLVAADRLNMSARLIELDERYADVIVRRWQGLTGRQAVHGATGEPFGE